MKIIVSNTKKKKKRITRSTNEIIIITPIVVLRSTIFSIIIKHLIIMQFQIRVHIDRMYITCIVIFEESKKNIKYHTDYRII